jgi:hypothetical protein
MTLPASATGDSGRKLHNIDLSGDGAAMAAFD